MSLTASRSDLHRGSPNNPVNSKMTLLSEALIYHFFDYFRESVYECDRAYRRDESFIFVGLVQWDHVHLSEVLREVAVR